jgi:hypothetical protein
MYCNTERTGIDEHRTSVSVNMYKFTSQKQRQTLFFSFIVIIIAVIGGYILSSCHSTMFYAHNGSGDGRGEPTE